MPDFSFIELSSVRSADGKEESEKEKVKEENGSTHWHWPNALVNEDVCVYHQHLCLHWPLIFLSHAITFSRCRAHLCTIKLYSYVYVHTYTHTRSQTGKKVDRYTPCRVMTMNMILCSKWNEIVRSLYPQLTTTKKTKKKKQFSPSAQWKEDEQRKHRITARQILGFPSDRRGRRLKRDIGWGWWWWCN